MYLPQPEDFEPWVGKRVRINSHPEPVEITLTRVLRQPARLGDFREPFTLFFESAPDVYLVDASYEMDVGRGGPYLIHIAQLIPKPGCRSYHAVFN